MKAADIKKENAGGAADKKKAESDEFKIPNEAACSAEFNEGCVIVESPSNKR